MAGTREDAQLLVQLAQCAATMGANEAVSALFEDGFAPSRARLGENFEALAAG
jgi:hypothetical protein